MSSCGETESRQQLTSDLELELEVARQEEKPKVSETKTCGASPSLHPWQVHTELAIPLFHIYRKGLTGIYHPAHTG